MRLPSWRAQPAALWSVTVMSERSLFLAALEYDEPAERSAYLERACAGEPALRAEVEKLLTPTSSLETSWATPHP